MTITGTGPGDRHRAQRRERARTRRTAERTRQAVDAAILSIEKQFGRGSIMKLGSSERQQVDAIPTGSIALDLALGVGGIPRGRITEIFGPESSGKTTLCQHVLAEAQQRGGVVAFIDVEHALDPQYARACGVNVDELLVSQPDTGEQALEITETLIRSGGVDCVVVDSVAALVPRAEIEGEMGDSFMGIQARLMSQALRKLTGAVSRSNTALVFTNQLREKIGVMFGNPETTPGGRALKFYASVRLDIRRIETIKTGTDSIGSRVRVKVVKNKVAAPFRVAEFDVMYGEGISREGGLLDVGVASAIVTKTGAWFTYGETRLGQGREQAKEFLSANQDVAQQLESEIRAQGRHDRRAGRGHLRGRVAPRDRTRRPTGERGGRSGASAGRPVTDRSGCRPGRRQPRLLAYAALGRRTTCGRACRHWATRRDLVDDTLERLRDAGLPRRRARSRGPGSRAATGRRPRGEVALRRELRARASDRELVDADAPASATARAAASGDGRRGRRGRRRGGPTRERGTASTRGRARLLDRRRARIRA